MFEPYIIKGKKYNKRFFRLQSSLRKVNPISVTSYFDIDPDDFEKTGAFDSVLNVDTRLFIDPFLLPYTSVPELKDGREKFLSHFQKVLMLLSLTKSQKDKTWKAAAKRLYFPEVKGFNLGYGNPGSTGSGMGVKFMQQLLETAFEITKKGIKNPIIFELLGLFEEGIGCDRISDMISRILYPEFVHFSQRVFTQLKVKGGYPIKCKNEIFNLPRNPFRKECIVLVPKDILRDLPIAYCWGDIDFICSTNKKLRDKLSSVIGSDWKKKTRKWKKGDFKKILFQSPDLLTDLIGSYKNSTPKFYNYREDPSGEANWLPLARRFTSKNPLILEFPEKQQNLNKLIEIVNRIITQFGKLVEYNGLNHFFSKIMESLKEKQQANYYSMPLQIFIVKPINLLLLGSLMQEEGLLILKLLMEI